MLHIFDYRSNKTIRSSNCIVNEIETNSYNIINDSDKYIRVASTSNIDVSKIILEPMGVDRLVYDCPDIVDRGITSNIPDISRSLTTVNNPNMNDVYERNADEIDDVTIPNEHNSSNKRYPTRNKRKSHILTMDNIEEYGVIRT